MVIIVDVPEKIDSSSTLQTFIDSIGNIAARYAFLPEHDIEINSKIRVYNNTEWDGGGCHFSLKENISTTVFGNGIPLIAPKYPTSAENLIFHDLKIDGNRDYQAAVSKLYSKPWGQGYHNIFMLGSLSNVNYNNSKNCEFYNISYKNGLGDLLRVEGGTNITAHDITAKRGGHDVICFVVDKGEIYNIMVDMAVNAGVRTRSARNVKIHDCDLKGTPDAYSPGIQIQSTADNWITENIEIYNNYIHDTLGPGIQIIGSVQNNGLVSVHHNIFSGCGQMPAANKLPGVGGIVYDGIPVEISNNTIDNCYGYGLLAGSYTMSSSYSATATIRRNIITNTKKAFYPGTGSGSGIADLTGGRYKITTSENCVYGSALSNHYKVSFSDYLRADPLYVSDDNYHLQSQGGHYTNSGEVVKDSVTSPCVSSEYEYGAFDGTSQASIYLPPALPAVVIPRRSADDLRAFIQALRAGGYLGEDEEISFLNVSDDFTV